MGVIDIVKPRIVQTHHTMKHRIMFNPLVYAQNQDAEALRQAFHLQSVEPAFEITVFRQPYRVPKHLIEVETERRAVWAIEMPPGSLTCEFRGADATATPAKFAQLVEAASTHFQATRKMLDSRRDFFVREGALFCRRVALEHVRHVMETPAYVNAVIAFLRAAEDRPSLVTGAPRPRRPHRTVAERVEHFGAVVKGPMWSPEEDNVLRMWFGVRSVGPHAGRHSKLEDHEWTHVLELLGGMRTANAVKNRLSVLNNQLRDRMLVNGFMPRDRLREYMQQALGEAPKRPPLRPYQRMRRKPREDRSLRRRPDVPAPPRVDPTSLTNDVHP